MKFFRNEKKSYSEEKFVIYLRLENDAKSFGINWKRYMGNFYK